MSQSRYVGPKPPGQKNEGRGWAGLDGVGNPELQGRKGEECPSAMTTSLHCIFWHGVKAWLPTERRSFGKQGINGPLLYVFPCLTVPCTTLGPSVVS